MASSRHAIFLCIVLTSVVFIQLSIRGVHAKFGQQTTPPLSSQEAGMTDNMYNFGRCLNPPDKVHSNYTVCGDGHCRCNRSVADCSRYTKDPLTYVPRLTPGIAHLIFINNSLVHIDDYFFLNVTDITKLDLSFNGIKKIAWRSFKPLMNLTHLILKGNDLSYDALAPVFSLVTLEYLDLVQNNLGSPPDGVFGNRLTRVQTLCLNGNNINVLDMKQFIPMSSLTFLDLGGNKLFVEKLRPAPLPQLVERLDLMLNVLDSILQTCLCNVSCFPNLISLSLARNRIGSEAFQLSQVCLPKLEILDLSYNMMTIFGHDMFGPRMFPSLRRLSVSDMGLPIDSVEKHAFRNPKLMYINTGNNNEMSFSSDNVDADMFDGCVNLEKLFLDNCDFFFTSTAIVKRLFSHSPKLDELSVRSSRLRQVNKEMFKNLKSLSVFLLTSNMLTEIPDGTFDDLPKLWALDLSNNKISIIKENTFSAATLKHLNYIDLSGNSLTCSCELRWFQQWLLTKRQSFRFEFEYRCNNMADTTVMAFQISEQSCMLSHEASRLIIFTAVTVIFSMTVFTLLYRYRWHIRLVLYEAFRGRDDRRRRMLEQNRYDYDVFVSYDSEDFPWVRQHLMPNLEEGLGLRLCIHERDFRPGKHIVENISHCVTSSKKIMMLFSVHFAASPWCQFELNMCLSHALENDDALLVVFLHDIPARKLTPAMMAVMKTTTYIGWGDQPEAQASFWGRVTLALNEVIPQ